MIVPRLIERKRDGERLEPREIRELVLAYAEGEVPDYQMAALLMAVYFRGLDRDEMNALMDAMLESGKRLDLTRLPMPRIDKHSTGGVGDKTSLILAPLISSLGVAVPMMSGRGLGHTGGTLDKLESIPGFRTALSLSDAEKQIARIGCAMLSQTAEIVPADRKLYALRDATGTVEVIPLIAASIMSKKIAESLTGLVLDVKRGSGSFLPKLDDELELANAMIDLGARHGCPVIALLTAMDRPLGHACGNALEVAEAIEVLKGAGPPDLIEVTLALGAEMLLLAAVGDQQRGSTRSNERRDLVRKSAAQARGDRESAGRRRERRARSASTPAGAPPVVIRRQARRSRPVGRSARNRLRSHRPGRGTQEYGGEGRSVGGLCDHGETRAPRGERTDSGDDPCPLQGGPRCRKSAHSSARSPSAIRRCLRCRSSHTASPSRGVESLA